MGMGMAQYHVSAGLLQLQMLFLLLLIWIALAVDAAQEKGRSNLIQPGSSLSPGKQPSSWASSSGRFEFGFYRQRGNGFAVGIWLVGVGPPEADNTSTNIIVWTANRDDPPLSSNTSLMFTAQGALQLIDLQTGKETNLTVTDDYWGDSAAMLDSGNFVVYDNRSVVWDSFDFPTDTILGGQNLSSWSDSNSLVSSISRSNRSTGQYFLRMQNDGNLVAYVNNSAEADFSDAYWETYTSGLSFDSLNLNKQGNLLLYGDDFVLSLANSSGIGDETTAYIIYRLTLDPDGIFRIYSHHFYTGGSNGTEMKMKMKMKMEWQSLDGQCKVKGYCGLNSYCSGRGNDVECYCYPGFTYIDHNRKFLGCSQNSTLDHCDQSNDVVMLYNITTLENMTWLNDPYFAIPNLSEDECKKDCERDCYCGGALYSDGNCKKCSMPLKYGRRGENISTTAFIKLISGSTRIMSPSSPTTPTPIIIYEGNQKLISIMGLTLGPVACLCFLIAVSSFLIYRRRLRRHRKLRETGILSATEQFTLHSFLFSELDKATNGFKDEIGRGSSGAVYKGYLQRDHEEAKAIAVKKLERVNQREREFRTEITVIGRTNHRNLVRLLGYCVEGSRKLLVYEYLSNGSLANFLFSLNVRPRWKERARIALEVAKGIRYLHDECEACIIHCNLKPQNILLDDFMTAKITDFGLAKLLRPDHQTSSSSCTNTGLMEMGTTRYSAPEWQAGNGSVSVKVDVYSFGVILLEIICCRSSIEVQVCSADEILLSTWVYNCFVAGELHRLVQGPQGEEEEEEDLAVHLKMLERFVKVGIWCIQDDPNLRPLMKNVVLMLEGTMDVPLPPSPSPSLLNRHH